MAVYTEDDYEKWRINNIELLKRAFIDDMKEQFNDFCQFYYESRIMNKKEK